MPAHTVLVTRPEPEASATAAQLRARGYQALVSPALVATALPVQVPKLKTATTVIVTSPQAARALGAWNLQNYPVLAVGARTAALLRDSGFTNIIVGGGTAQAITVLTAQQPPQDYCLCGAPSTGHTLCRTLQAQGHSVQRCDVYAIEPVIALSVAAIDAFKANTISHILFYSARSARAFLRQTTRAGLIGKLNACEAICLSTTVAAVVKTAFAAVQVAVQPTAEALQRLLPKLDSAHDRTCCQTDRS